ncbi:hypothetical protein Bca52824_009371 [Brassica carinata]|uniref:Pentatricopeptide repeat-containing protein n=1 Tax=Brassica carinata TaxID=52824 RepID=A0A8X7W9R7_BRACI|nr:hypothetical protein Bca52824_009371 [Brassica carinata]
MVEEVWKNNGGAPWLIACTTLVEGLRKSGRAEKASEFMEKMMMSVGLVPDSVTLNLLLRSMRFWSFDGCKQVESVGDKQRV